MECTHNMFMNPIYNEEQITASNLGSILSTTLPTNLAAGTMPNMRHIVMPPPFIQFPTFENAHMSYIIT